MVWGLGGLKTPRLPDYVTVRTVVGNWSPVAGRALALQIFLGGRHKAGTNDTYAAAVSPTPHIAKTHCALGLRRTNRLRLSTATNAVGMQRAAHTIATQNSAGGMLPSINIASIQKTPRPAPRHKLTTNVTHARKYGSTVPTVKRSSAPHSGQ